VVEVTATIRVSELFGPTIQGEGPNAGRRAAFVRLVDCNLDCAWCDTPHTWDWSGKNGVAFIRKDEYFPMTTEEVLSRLAPMNVPRVVVTGGEPLLRQPQLVTLVSALKADGYLVEVETNGTFIPVRDLRSKVDQWNVSPKLASAQTTMPSIIPEALTFFAQQPNTAFKFVIGADLADLDQVVEVVELHHLPHHRVWLMPEGRTALEQVAATRMVAEAAIDAGFNFTSRLHTLAWGDERLH
jgi:7-cyano-7-deazaguanosine (preQ0) biosynthesis protein QueE